MKLVTFKVEEELLHEVERLATRLGITRSELIRRALQRYVKEHEDVAPREQVITIRRIELY